MEAIAPSAVQDERARILLLTSGHGTKGSKANFRYVSLNISENAFEVLPEVVTDDVTSGFALSLSTNERFRNFASALDE